MRRLVASALLLQALTLAVKRDDCTLAVKEEQEYTCQLPNGTITLGAKKNDYVNVICEGSNIDCADIPQFDFASGQSLSSVGLKSCPPSILRCINDVAEASSVNGVTLISMTEPLSGEDVLKLGPVKKLILRDADVQTTVPIAAIKNLPTLTEVRIGGGNMQLTPHAFEGAPPLTYLEFSEDHLTAIPPDSFSGLSSLSHLNIWGNNITNITVGAFRGLDELRKLSLSTIKLKSIEPGSFETLLKLNNVYFMKNDIELIPNGLLQDLKELQDFTLIFNKVELSFGTEALANLPSLKNVKLEYNSISTLPEALFNGSSNIEILSFVYNRIEDLPSKVFTGLSALKRLHLSRNRIKSLSETVFYHLKSLEYLDMSYNRLEVLPKELFAGLKKLKTIFFDNNNIFSIASTTFVGLDSIEMLSLGYNNLSLDKDTGSLKYELLSDFGKNYYSPFNNLLTLKKLRLIRNKISMIFEDWRIILNQLEYLDLRQNKFTEIGLDQNPNASYFLQTNLTVDLRENEIDRIYLSRGPYRRDNVNNATIILLDNNPFKCDCHMYDVKLRLDGVVALRNEPKLIFENAQCFLPLDLRGIRLTEVSPTDLVCNLSENNSDNCTTIARPSTNELILNCPRFPSVLPDTNEVTLLEYFNKKPTITVESKQPPISIESLNVHKLVLSNIGLKNVDFKPSKHLKILDLSNNSISKVPEAFLDSNISLYLVNNPLECSCWTEDDIVALKSYKYVHNATCEDGRLINQVDVKGLCNLQNALAISLATLLFIVFCVVFTTIIIYKYFNEIVVFMISRGICKSCVKRIVSDKEYDVFISFAHEDLTYVDDTLLPKLENDFGQKVCVHYRNWNVGEVIPDQINYSVLNSRKTIIVMSKSFLESMWAKLEFFAAHNLTRQENSSRIILILFDEDLAYHPSLSAEMKAYISTNTYLLRGDPNFWKKLDKALERKSYRITWLESLKHKSKDKKHASGGLDVQLHNGQLINMAVQNVSKPNGLNYDSV